MSSDMGRPVLRGLDGTGGNRHAGRMDESRQWVEFGRWLTARREERGLRRREAAKRAKLPEAQWRDLETGRKEAVGGIRLLPNPSHEVLERVAGVLEVPVDEVLAQVGRPVTATADSRGALNGSSSDGDGSLSAKVGRLSVRDRAAVEALIDAMLLHDGR